MEIRQSPEITVILETVGGFAAPTGPELLTVDWSRLMPAEAEILRRDLAAIPDTAWGAAFRAPHPRSSDFHHRLRVGAGVLERFVAFDSGQGPDVVRRVAEFVMDHGSPD